MKALEICHNKTSQPFGCFEKLQPEASEVKVNNDTIQNQNELRDRAQRKNLQEQIKSNRRLEMMEEGILTDADPPAVPVGMLFLPPFLKRHISRVE